MRFWKRFARGELRLTRIEVSPPTQRQHGSPPAAAVTTASHPVRLQRLVGLAAIVLITALAYLPIFRGGFIWDDETWITDNRLLRTLGGLRAIWLEPGPPSTTPSPRRPSGSSIISGARAPSATIS